MGKIHYTVYSANFERCENTIPICNSSQRIWFHQLTRDIENITCKKCIKSLISIKKQILEIDKKSSFSDEQEIEKINKDIETLTAKIINIELKGFNNA